MKAEVETDAILACADLCARAGAQQFEFGYIRDEPENPGWYAQAYFRGARLIADERPSPDEACDALARRILAGGKCTGCGKTVALTNPTKQKCAWHRDGPAWVRGCDGKREATPR